MIPQVKKELPELYLLARDAGASAQARRKLAERLTSLFMSDDVLLSGSEEAAFVDLISMLLESSGSDDAPSEEVGSVFRAPNLPRSIARTIASAPSVLARPVLLENMKLTDEDLIFVIGTQGMDHASYIAQRKIISEAVTDALVTTGSVEVMKLVAENLGARLSPHAVVLMTEAARFAEPLQEPMLNRSEVQERDALKIFWWAKQSLRRFAMDRYGFSQARMEQALKDAIDEMLARNELKKNNKRAMIRIADWLVERKENPTELLPQILRGGYFTMFRVILARIAKLPLPVIRKLVMENGGAMLAALCKALGMNKPTFLSVFLLSRGARDGDGVVHPREMNVAMQAFEKLTIEQARTLLRTWRAHPELVQGKA